MKFNEIIPLNLEQVEKLFLEQIKTSSPDQILEWSSHQNFSFIEEMFSVGDKDIYRFQGSAEMDKTTFYSFGRSTDRKLAAIKSAAELIERLIFDEFTRNEIGLNLAIKIKNTKFEILRGIEPIKIDRSFYNSNGWAVDFSVEKAIGRAVREAIERHLLILTFAKLDWDGFFEVDKTSLNHFELTSIISKYSVAGFSAGMALCQSSKFSGVSFGYLLDGTETILKSEKWEQAFYESYDLVRVKETTPDAIMQNDLIGQELEYFLKTPFSQKFSAQYENTQLVPEVLSNLAVVDLKEVLGLPVPFYAAVVHGGDLLPLYFSQSLSEAGKEQITRLNNKWNVANFLTRHPVL